MTAESLRRAYAVAPSPTR